MALNGLAMTSVKTRSRYWQLYNQRKWLLQYCAHPQLVYKIAGVSLALVLTVC